jgi:IS5 family transposase
VQEYRAKYDAISLTLDFNPRILEIAHGDFSRVLSTSEYGRGGYTSEQILRSIVVMFTEQESYRDTVILVENSEFMRNFIKLGNKGMMDFTFLCKAYTALSEETWKRINEALGGYACKEEKITAEKLRLDTTTYETNIHYPTDSSLLWDSYRTVARVMKDSRDELRALGLTHRFHTKKVRKLALYISRNSTKKEEGIQRKIKSTYRKLIERVRWIVAVGKTAEGLLSGWNMVAMAELKHYLPITEKIIGQAERRVIQGEQVPSAEKVYSLFEEHTELLKRGKAGKPIEFGHNAEFIVMRRGEPRKLTIIQLFQQCRVVLQV